jgi:hypothetical protein
MQASMFSRWNSPISFSRGSLAHVPIGTWKKSLALCGAHSDMDTVGAAVSRLSTSGLTYLNDFFVNILISGLDHPLLLPMRLDAVLS